MRNYERWDGSDGSNGSCRTIKERGFQEREWVLFLGEKVIRELWEIEKLLSRKRWEEVSSVGKKRMKESIKKMWEVRSI